MNEPDYTKIISLLDSASGILAANAGNLNPADLRIRCLVNITGKEAHRALLETAAATGSRTGVAKSHPGWAAGIIKTPAPVQTGQ
ncbi:MAG TPA: hypothetical protein VM029_10595 [Opitutaceae bacterium]|nr:hypothetical protein [Opitutaceae bacterium]